MGGRVCSFKVGVIYLTWAATDFMDTWAMRRHCASYGLSVLLIMALVIQSLMGKSAVLKSVKYEQQREARLQKMQQKGETL